MVVIDAAAVADYPVRVWAVVIRASAFRDLDDRTVVVAGDAQDHVIERLRPDLPVEVGLGTLLAAVESYREQPFLGVGGAVHGARSRYDRAVIKIDRDEIQGRPCFLHIAGLDPHGSLGQEGKRIGIMPAQSGIEKPG